MKDEAYLGPLTGAVPPHPTMTGVINEHEHRLDRYSNQLELLFSRCRKIEECLGVNFGSPVMEQTGEKPDIQF